MNQLAPLKRSTTNTRVQNMISRLQRRWFRCDSRNTVATDLYLGRRQKWYWQVWINSKPANTIFACDLDTSLSPLYCASRTGTNVFANAKSCSGPAYWL